jgi:hypothetical protein
MNRIIAIIIAVLVSSVSLARDDGRYATSQLKSWFDGLTSHKGLCCSFADGQSVQDVDWESSNGQYRVYIYGQWILVPADAVVTVPNKFGLAVVWPYIEGTEVKIRCFIAGALS